MKSFFLALLSLAHLSFPAQAESWCKLTDISDPRAPINLTEAKNLIVTYGGLRQNCDFYSKDKKIKLLAHTVDAHAFWIMIYFENRQIFASTVGHDFTDGKVFLVGGLTLTPDGRVLDLECKHQITKRIEDLSPVAKCP